MSRCRVCRRSRYFLADHKLFVRFCLGLQSAPSRLCSCLVRRFILLPTLEAVQSFALR